MSRISRRRALRSLAAAAVGLAGTGLAAGGFLTRNGGFRPADATPREAVELSTSHDIVKENLQVGSNGWRPDAEGVRPADDLSGQIKGYASVTSAREGDHVDFHVSVSPPEHYTIAFYRLGHYGGVGARHMLTADDLAGAAQPGPDLDPATGLISCPWAASYTLKVPASWTTGLYLAVFTTRSGWRSCTPFVVRSAHRSAGIAVVLPFTTYQAYNQWPLDGVRGKSLYNGYAADPRPGHQADGAWKAGALDAATRGRKVTFDRPYEGNGLPKRFDDDRSFIGWAEESGFPLSYYSSVDLEDGTLDPAAHTAVVFAGHDEYWSRRMRDRTAAALNSGTSLAFMTANNMYWHIRFEAAADGRPNRVVTCYKATDDPVIDRTTVTMRWRETAAGPNQPEQALLGSQYNGIVAAPVPLVVRGAEHWFWANTTVKNGQAIPKIVGGEADGFDPGFASPVNVYRHALLSASPYILREGTPSPLRQNTSLYETLKGAIVFVAGTLYWTKALATPGFQNPIIRTASANLFRRMLERRSGVGMVRVVARRILLRGRRAIPVGQTR